MPKSALLAAVALATMLGACSGEKIAQSEAPASFALAAAENTRAAEAAAAAAARAAQRIAEAATAAERERLRTGIEVALQQDRGAGQLGSDSATASAMRAIDVSNTPAEFQAAYVTHIHAWEDVARLRAAWKRFDTDEKNGKVLLVGFVCAMVDCPATPIADRVEAEQEYNRQLSAARARISVSFHEVERVAASYGAQLPA